MSENSSGCIGSVSGRRVFLSGPGGEWFFARVCRLGGSAGHSIRLPIDRAGGEENSLSRSAPGFGEWIASGQRCALTLGRRIDTVTRRRSAVRRGQDSSATSDRDRTRNESPPKGGDPAPLRATAKRFAGKVHAIGVSDNRHGVCMAALAAAGILAAEGVDPILHMVTRDRNRIALLSDCLGAQALDVPILLTEQYPEGMGSTIPEIAELLDGVKPLAKTSFSCCGDDGFTEAFANVGREQALLVGIETHICVWQTAYDLLESDYEVHVVADAVSSRKAENKHIGLENMRDSGAIMTCTETALFELLRVAEGPKFKKILKLVK